MGSLLVPCTCHGSFTWSRSSIAVQMQPRRRHRAGHRHVPSTAAAGAASPRPGAEVMQPQEAAQLAHDIASLNLVSLLQPAESIFECAALHVYHRSMPHRAACAGGLAGHAAVPAAGK